MKAFKSIYEFQRRYPTQKAREAFVKKLTNEEIDELVDLCNVVQGKIYYQDQKKQEVIFRYTLSDAWSFPKHSVEIEDGPSIFVRYGNGLDGLGDVFLVPEGEAGAVRLTRETLFQIRKVLDDELLFETESLEPPFDVMIMDGYTQSFEIASKGRHIKAFGGNIQYCKGDTEHCPHSVRMIRVLREMEKILVPLGVPKKYLSLTAGR